MIRLCISAGCPDPAVYRGRCQRCARQRNRDTRSPNKAVYNTKRWKYLRRRVLSDQPLCSCGEIATDVDHIQPLSEGGAPYARANVQAKCRSCHSSKTRQEQINRKDHDG